MSKLEMSKLWQQAENKSVQGIFKSISHFSDGHLLTKLLSPDNWDNSHKDSWPVSETKPNKRCRTATSHPWLKADCGLALLFPTSHFSSLNFPSSPVSQSFLNTPLQDSFHGHWKTFTCSQYSAAVGPLFSLSPIPIVSLQWKLGPPHTRFKPLWTGLFFTSTFDAILHLLMVAD